MGKCPKCPKKFPASKAGYKAYKKHYYEKHVPASMKAKNKKDIIYKIPPFVAAMKSKK